MKKITCLCLIMTISISVFSQIETNHWRFGTSSGLSFNTNPPQAVLGSSLSTSEGSSSISDINGNLLFYTDGVTVWDRQDNAMPNGTGLVGNFTSAQSALILPMPGNPGIYYVITAPAFSTSNPLAYSIVDITLNGGLGDVSVKNVTLLASSTEKVTAVRHSNGYDIWIVAHAFGSADFYSFLLTQSGITTPPVVSTAGNPVSNNFSKIGILKAAPCGGNIAMTNSSAFAFLPSTLELFDFNNANGAVSGALLIGNWNNSVFNAYGIEFSPDNSKLYVTSSLPARLVQYDISSGSLPVILASSDTIASSTFYQFYSLQTGRDGKIYSAKYLADSLACITYPNLSGTACGYVPEYVYLITACQLGLPNYLTSYFCNLSSGDDEPDKNEEVQVFPNPFTDQISVQLNQFIKGTTSCILTDIYGKVILGFSENDISEPMNISLNTASISHGVYILTITNGNRVINHKIVKQSD